MGQFLRYASGLPIAPRDTCFLFSALPSVYYAIKIFDAAKADGGHIKNDGAPQPYLVTIQPELETYGKAKFLKKKCWPFHSHYWEI